MGRVPSTPLAAPLPVRRGCDRCQSTSHAANVAAAAPQVTTTILGRLPRSARRRPFRTEGSADAATADASTTGATPPAPTIDSMLHPGGQPTTGTWLTEPPVEDESFTSRELEDRGYRGFDMPRGRGGRGSFVRGGRGAGGFAPRGRGEGGHFAAPAGESWPCASCGANNFSYRRDCFKCQQPKAVSSDPSATAVPSSQPPRAPSAGPGMSAASQPGSWACSCGATNFKSRNTCFKCQCPRALV